MTSENPLLYIANDGLSDYGAELAASFQLQLVSRLPSTPYLLLEDTLALVQPDTKFKPLTVDFLTGKNRHRRMFGGGKNQLMCKAVGLNKGVTPRVLDLTAGLGQDAFVLAGFGCNMSLVERSPYAAALLADGLKRLTLEEPELGARLAFSFGDSNAFEVSGKFDVVYLDPMYPDTGQKAAVKKSMAIFRDLIGKDEDADKLLDKAFTLAINRVVVKRPIKGEYLAGREPSYSLKGKTSRYDIYALKAFRG